MSNFGQAYKRLSLVEGTYSNDPIDPGCETVGGIARRYWPDWEGWVVVDAAKSKLGFKEVLASDSYLQGMIKAFYKREFWDKFRLDELAHALAEEIFEQSVNLGLGKATEHLQKVLNCLNHKNQWGADLKVDKTVGPATLARLGQAVKSGRGKAVQFGINGLQCAYYVDLGLKDPIKRKYTGGWLVQRGGAQA